MKRYTIELTESQMEEFRNFLIDSGWDYFDCNTDLYEKLVTMAESKGEEIKSDE